MTTASSVHHISTSRYVFGDRTREVSVVLIENNLTITMNTACCYECKSVEQQQCLLYDCGAE